MCVAAIGLEDVAALQLAQPSLGKMAVKEPAQPFWCHIPRLVSRLKMLCAAELGSLRAAREECVNACVRVVFVSCVRACACVRA